LTLYPESYKFHAKELLCFPRSAHVAPVSVSKAVKHCSVFLQAQKISDKRELLVDTPSQMGLNYDLILN